jgi:serine protease Do
MKRLVGLLVVSLIVGAAITWIVRPLDITVRWGDDHEQSATVSVHETLAQADWTPGEKQAIVDAEATSKAFVAIAKEVSPCVVTVYSERIIATNDLSDRHPFQGMFPDGFFDRFFEMPDRVPQRGMGSGVIISEDGLILTNNHVVDRADRVRVTLSDGRSFDAEVRGTDPRSDIAVLHADAGGLPAARLGSSEELQIGEWVLAIGAPFQLPQTVTAGIVSAKGRSSVGLAEYEDFIQTDAAINPGNSGGALVNLRGEVVGINTAIASRSGGSQGVGFAIPIDMARKIKDSLIEHGRVARGYLGVTIQNVDDALADNYGLDRPHGALVNSVMSGTPADEAGIKVGDLILEINGAEVQDRDHLRLKISSLEPGASVELTVLRDGKKRTFNVRLGELSDDEESARGTPEDSDAPSLGNLGLDVEPITSALRQRFELDPDIDGLLVTNVEPGTPASDAGLREGDIIIEAGNTEVPSISALREQIAGVEPGRTLLTKVHRQGANIFLAIRIPKS